MSPSLPENPRLSHERAAEVVRGFAGVRVAVLGDVMLDRYFWGEVDRISPEAPVPVVRVTRRSARAGGAANVAANLRALGVAVDVVGVVGDDREAGELVDLLGSLGVDGGGMHVVPGRETTEKVRIIARSQQVVRADFESGEEPDDDARAQLLERTTAMSATHDALVVSDYGKGLLGEKMLGDLIPHWRRAGRPVLVDPHVPHFEWYRGATVITPNASEASRATGIAFDGDRASAEGAFGLLRDLGLDALLVTRGEHGMSLYHGQREELHVPTVAREVYDVTGAGDTVIGVLAAALATGVDLVEGVLMSNVAAGEVVKEVGTTTLSAEALASAFRHRES